MTIRRASSIKSLLVAGFRPRCSFFPFTQNLPKPEIRISSPDTRVCLMVSKRESIRSLDLFLGNREIFYTLRGA